GSWAHLLPWGPVDLVVSNPPYVFHRDMEKLAPEILSYEDPLALDGGEEGMDIITHILALAPRLLKDAGSIFLEVDSRHPELVGSWLQSQPDLSLNLVAVRRDFCGRPRFLHIRRLVAARRPKGPSVHSDRKPPGWQMLVLACIRHFQGPDLVMQWPEAVCLVDSIL
ncbi:HemK methyltransferase family member 1, partial [Eschrichtius robustus]|nr:HemK methyltransferase family member 1 [Eschrichtius robustus]